MKTATAALSLCVLFAAANATLASPADGTLRTTDVVSPNHYIEYRVYLLAGEPTRIAVRGDGQGDVDLYLFDENGHRIDYDNDYTDTCFASVTPAWSGNFTIRVVNAGSIPDQYTITVW